MKILFTVAVVLLASSQSYAKTLKCICKDNNCHDQKVVLNAQKLSMSALDPKEDTYKEAEVFTAKRDLTYRPRASSNQSKIRYVDAYKGRGAGNHREVIITEGLLTGAVDFGYMQIRGDEDGFWSANFVCSVSN